MITPIGTPLRTFHSSYAAQCRPCIINYPSCHEASVEIHLFFWLQTQASDLDLVLHAVASIRWSNTYIHDNHEKYMQYSYRTLVIWFPRPCAKRVPRPRAPAKNKHTTSDHDIPAKTNKNTTYLHARRESAPPVLSVPAPARHAYRPSARPHDRPTNPHHRDGCRAPSRSAPPSRRLSLLGSARAVAAAWARCGGRLSRLRIGPAMRGALLSRSSAIRSS